MSDVTDNFTAVYDIEYGAHERQKFDIFVPHNIKSHSGIILFIHGGGWSQGGKYGHYDDCKYFSNLGYVCATMNYRFVSDSLTVFDELDDITSALKKIKEECEKYSVNAEKVILSGGSAGSHLSLLYSYTRKDEAPVTPVAVCVWCPPVNCYAADFLLGISGEFEDWKYGILSQCCGVRLNKSDFLNEDKQTALRKMSPCEYIDGNDIPVAVFHGKTDEIVPFGHIQDFIKVLNEKGIRNNLIVYENSGHALDKDPDSAVQAKNIIKEYAAMYL